MGQSTDAYLFYGYCWDDEDTEFSTDMSETVKAILVERGHADPWDGCPDGGDYRAYRAAHESEFARYRELEKQVEEELGVDWDSHCSDGCPMPLLFVRGTKTTAWRGSPRPVTSIDVDPAWKPKLDAFLESQGIEPPSSGENQPGWWVASWWG